jgi:1-acyl-sn-glycerol-3-phosphate acyltransferase
VRPLTQTARLFFAISLLAVELVVLGTALLLLLPSRVARVRFTCRCARLFGGTFTWVTGVRTRWKGPADQPPAIYICNHASSLDFFVVMTHVPRNTCCVGKRELLYIPFLGPFYALGGHLLIDRRNPERAHASLSKAAAFVRANGMNVWLAPEGTRSKDGTLGEFKKGFVHTAIATGLPVVPVLLHGFAERWPLGTWRIEPGEAVLEVLAPIDTTAWTAETATEHAASVREVFLAGLGKA